MAVIAVLYATPWDNYLVYREIWRYPMDRILFRIWHVPVEEYFFFIVQSLIQSTLLLLLLPRSGMTRKHSGSAIAKSSIARWRLTGFLCYSASAIAGVIALIVSGRALYLGLILAWAAPVLAAQWWFASGAIAHFRKIFLLAVLVPAVYFSVADRLAIASGIWEITDATRTGIDIIGLPLEEGLFFLVTSLMVVQGLFWFLYPSIVANATQMGARTTALK